MISEAFRRDSDTFRRLSDTFRHVPMRIRHIRRPRRSLKHLAESLETYFRIPFILRWDSDAFRRMPTDSREFRRIPTDSDGFRRLPDVLAAIIYSSSTMSVLVRASRQFALSKGRTSVLGAWAAVTQSENLLRAQSVGPMGGQGAPQNH